MRGLPALIWDGSVLDPGLSFKYILDLSKLTTFFNQMKESGFGASPFLSVSSYFRRLPVAQNLCLKAFSGF